MASAMGHPEMDEECKMFVGGLTRDTTPDMLKGYFSYYGRIMHSIVMTNPETHKSRGFGFVTFERPESVDRVLMAGPHYLDGKQIDPKPSVPKDQRPKTQPVDQPKKAFLGGLPLEMNEADMRDYFSRYGVVTECYIMYDEKRLKSRGFGFVSFEDDNVVDDLVQQHYIDVKGKKVEVKLARPRENPLAPLNSEGRVLSTDALQQRAVAVAAEAAGLPPPPARYFDSNAYYSAHSLRGPPEYALKRPRPGAHTPPMPQRPSSYSPGPPPGYFYGYPYESDRAPPPKRPRSSVPVPKLSPMGDTSSFATVPYGSSGYSSRASNTNAGSTMDPANMSPESMMAMMQQTMQNMGGMNMMMPMVMSNVMTQMFMNQAQSLCKSTMQQRNDKPPTPSKPVGETSSSAPAAEMMEAMKSVFQTMMSTMQQQQFRSGSKPNDK